VCSNSTCLEASPTYYTARQRAYRSTPKGISVHNATSAKYRNTPKGKSLVKATYATWASRNIRVDALTLREGLPFLACNICVEYRDGSCSVAQGAESIDVCEVYQDFKHTGTHPLKSLYGSSSGISAEEEEYWARYG